MRPVQFINGKWVLTRDATPDDQQQQHYMVGPGLVGSFDPDPALRAFSRRKYRSWARGEHNQSRQPFVWDSRTGKPTLLSVFSRFFLLLLLPHSTALRVAHSALCIAYPLHPSFVSAPHRYLVQMEAARPRHKLDTKPEPECGSSESSL